MERKRERKGKERKERGKREEEEYVDQLVVVRRERERYENM